MVSINDKRKSQRVNCLVPVEGKKNSYFDRIRTINFSKGGFGLISAKNIPVNEEITIEIDFNGQSSSAFVIGKVKWARRLSCPERYILGLSFESFLRGSISLLNKYF